MIVLLDTENIKDTYLVKSIMNEYGKCLCLVCKSDVDRPEFGVSMCEYYAMGDNANTLYNGKTYFLQTKIPNEYQVAYYDEDRAVVKDKYRAVAYIYYTEPKIERYVERIEWIDSDGEVLRTDYYANHGYMYLRKEYRAGSNGSRIVTHKRWYDSDGETIFEWSNHADCYFQYKNGCITNIIQNFSEIEAKVMERIRTQNICVTEPKQLIMLADSGMQDFSNVYCKVQSIEALQAIREIYNSRNISPNVDIYNSDLLGISELLPGERRVKYQSSRKLYGELRGGAMIMTSTEDVVEIEKLVNDFTDLEFYIAAHTMVSPRLANLNELDNVHVIPGLAEWDLEYYLKKCDYFFDITHGYEVYDCCTKALLNGLLFIGYDDTVRKKTYPNADYVFSAWDYEALSIALRECIDNPECYWAALGKQSMG